MSAISIEWLWESRDCDQAGCSGGYSEGARVKIDGKTALELTPHASCFGGDSWSESEVFRLILAHLGHTVEEASA
jgi:hypothetical protein